MRFFILATALFCSAFSALAGGNDHAALPSAALAPAPVVKEVAAPTAARSAYELAWQRATATKAHTDALRVADALATAIDLRPGTTRATLERFIDQQMAECPGCYAGAAADPTAMFQKMIREDVRGFQRTLSALLPDQAYAKYVALLDAMNVTAQ